jgi:hypothetical protein
MQHRLIKASVRGLVAAALVFGMQPAIAVAQTPTVDELVARYVDAIGGRDAVLGATSSRTVGHVEVPAAGMTGDVEVLVAGPGNMLQRTTIPGFGESVSGLTDGRAWAIDPMQGARLVEGAEAEQLANSADPTVALRDASHFTTREVIGTREVDGEQCVDVRFVWQSGREMVDCFSVESGLLVASRSTVDSPMGSIEIVSRITEYRDFGGLRIPTVIRQEMGPIQQHLTISSVEYGTVTDADVEPPAQIRALLDR